MKEEGKGYIQSLIQATRQEVNFDPTNLQHLETARLMFDPTPKPITLRTEEDKKKLAQHEADMAKRRSLTIRFRLEPPFHDVRTMVLAKVFKWALSLPPRMFGSNVVSLESRREK